jgi:hypothetical protein
MNTIARIIEIYKSNCVGQENAITKTKFLSWYLFNEGGISERKFRQMLASHDENNLPLIPVCTSNAGAFWPKSLAEVKAWERVEHKRAMSVLSRIKRVREFHEERFRKESFQQRDLF